jgi:hypothetical protein
LLFPFFPAFLFRLRHLAAALPRQVIRDQKAVVNFAIRFRERASCSFASVPAAARSEIPGKSPLFEGTRMCVRH